MGEVPEMNEKEKKSFTECVDILRDRARFFIDNGDISFAQSALTASEALRAIRDTLEVYDAGIGRPSE